MSAELNQLILDVLDLERSISFYTDVLSLEVCDRTTLDGHALAILRAGFMRLLLVQQPA